MKSPAKSPLAPRDRLIQAAGEIFGEQGYAGATVREITKQADVNLAAINYYFRDKEELYWEVLKHATHAALKCDILPDESLPAPERLEIFVAGLLRHLLDPNRPDWHGKLMAREMSAPTRLLNVLIETFIRPKRDALLRILGEVAGRPLSDEELGLLSASVMGQCVYYRQNRPVIEQLFPQLLKGEDTIPRLAKHIATFSLAGIRAVAEPRPAIP